MIYHLCLSYTGVQTACQDSRAFSLGLGRSGEGEEWGMKVDTVGGKNVYTTALETPSLPGAESPSKSRELNLKNLHVLGGVCSHEWMLVLLKQRFPKSGHCRVWSLPVDSHLLNCINRSWHPNYKNAQWVSPWKTVSNTGSGPLSLTCFLAQPQKTPTSFHRYNSVMFETGLIKCHLISIQQ